MTKDEIPALQHFIWLLLVNLKFWHGKSATPQYSDTLNVTKPANVDQINKFTAIFPIVLSTKSLYTPGLEALRAPLEDVSARPGDSHPVRTNNLENFHER
ncbi:hypothetical protein [Maritalea sp.]|uniref:hypothetical protein n=1 Tax=Maritalea sp. TaxID=2003361 RepID=UPI003EF38A39